MQRTRLFKSLAMVAAASLSFAACGDDEKESDSTGGGDATLCDASKGPAEKTKVTLQLQWFTQAQFAGYFAAVDQGFYAEAGLDVEIVEGAVDIVPQDGARHGGPTSPSRGCPRRLPSREAGANIVEHRPDLPAQRHAAGQLQGRRTSHPPRTSPARRSATGASATSSRSSPLLAKEGLDPATDVELVGQNFDMSGLLAGDIDAAEAMTYNEYAQVLEAVNPDTGELYTADDLNVVSYEEEGVGMLQDAIWADGQARRRSRRTRHRRRVREGLAEGLGLLPRQRRGVPRHRRREGLRRSALSSAVADERDQQAHLAGRRRRRPHRRRLRGIGRSRSRPARRTSMAADGLDRAGRPGGVHQRDRRRGTRRARRRGVDVHGDGLATPIEVELDCGRRLTVQFQKSEGRVASAARPSRVSRSTVVAAAPWLFVVLWSTGFVAARYATDDSGPLMFLADQIHHCGGSTWHRWPRRLAWHARSRGLVPGCRSDRRTRTPRGVSGGRLSRDQLGHAFRRERADRRSAPRDHRDRCTCRCSANACSQPQWIGVALGFAGVIAVVVDRLVAGARDSMPIGAIAASVLSTIGICAGHVGATPPRARLPLSSRGTLCAIRHVCRGADDRSLGALVAGRLRRSASDARARSSPWHGRCS